MKARRQAEILAIIQEYDIETQDQLLEKLREKGMKSTQATISRDIKELHLVKELTGRSTYKYAVSEAENLPECGWTPEQYFSGKRYLL